MMEVTRGSTRSHSVESSLWTEVWGPSQDELHDDDYADEDDADVHDDT